MTHTNSSSGQSWTAFSREEQLRDYQSQLKELIGKLDSTVNVHVTHRLEDNHNEVMEAIGKLDLKVTNHDLSAVLSAPPMPSTSSFHPIIPPLPTDIFTGRDDYLRKLEEEFELSGTAARKEKQRVFVLYGSGGMGKTQLALKFIDEQSDRYVSRSHLKGFCEQYFQVFRQASVLDRCE